MVPNVKMPLLEVSLAGHCADHCRGSTGQVMDDTWLCGSLTHPAEAYASLVTEKELGRTKQSGLETKALGVLSCVKDQNSSCIL